MFALPCGNFFKTNSLQHFNVLLLFPLNLYNTRFQSITSYNFMWYIWRWDEFDCAAKWMFASGRTVVSTGIWWRRHWMVWLVQAVGHCSNCYLAEMYSRAALLTAHRIAVRFAMTWNHLWVLLMLLLCLLSLYSSTPPTPFDWNAMVMRIHWTKAMVWVHQMPTLVDRPWFEWSSIDQRWDKMCTFYSYLFAGWVHLCNGAV